MRLRAVEPILALSPLLLLITGCTSSPASPPSSSTAGGGAVTTYQTGIGPIALAPGVEETNCITIRLGNAEGGFVRRFRADLGEGSHHMIVYQSLDATESPDPTPCQALGGILKGEHPVFIAQQAHAELDFPTDDTSTPVGFEIAPNQMVRIEFHTINTTAAPLMVTGAAYLDVLPLSAKVTLGDLAFWGTTKFTIPPMSTATSGTAAQPVLYQAGIPGTKSFAVTTHQHHLGTELQVWYGTGASDTTNLVADGKDWSNPPLVMLDPPIDFPADGSKGLAYECHWNNPTTQTVQFGESFNDEMCFVWHYYYPSQGFQSCIDGKCQLVPAP